MARQESRREAPVSRDTDAPRLNRSIAQSGFCSRRRADELIFAGRVSVNGNVEQDPTRRLLPHDVLSVDGTVLDWEEREKRYLLLNKPVHTVCTVRDPEGRRTVLDLLPASMRQSRLFPVGRLDYFSEGLLLLTNDGDLANHLMHPRYHLPKQYVVIVRGRVRPETIHIMQNGMTLRDGTVLQPVDVQPLPSLPSAEHETTYLLMTLYQGINRQIRRMCDDLDLVILRLVRISQGPVSLGTLEVGSVRELSSDEVESLRKACQMDGQDLSGKELSGKDRSEKDMHGKELHGNDAHGKERLGKEIHGKDAHGKDVHIQDRSGKGRYGKAEKTTSPYRQERRGNSNGRERPFLQKRQVSDTSSEAAPSSSGGTLRQDHSSRSGAPGASQARHRYTRTPATHADRQDRRRGD